MYALNKHKSTLRKRFLKKIIDYQSFLNFLHSF